jgi:hypothetical protein
MKLFSVICSFILLTCAACAPPAGSEYVGKWQNIKKQPSATITETLEISKNGDNFIVESTRGITPTDPKNKPVQQPTKKLAVIFKDGVLGYNTGFGSIDFMIDQASKKMIVAGEEYSKITQ